MSISKISLGTVKFGMPNYGFSSSSNNLAPNEVLKHAAQLGITHLDTSPRYGDSEVLIGRYMQQHPESFRISTKVDLLKPNNPKSPGIIIESAQNSLHRLNTPQIEIFYLHQNEIEIISDPYIQEGLQKVKELGFARKVGVSIYSEEECEYALNHHLFDVVQMPINVFDLSMYVKNVLNMTGTNKTIVARSLLLQGVLQNRQQLRARIKQADQLLNYLQLLDELAKNENISTVDLALAYTFNLTKVDQFIIGSTQPRNITANLNAMNIKLQANTVNQITELAILPKAWSNPRNWEENKL